MRKNINPKTLKGQDKLNRMLNLMDRMNTLSESKSFSELELIKKGPNGIVYGVIRENHDYFIKTSNKTSGQFLAEDFNYIGGLQNKYDERYKSYAEAIKHLNMKFDMLNESYGIDSNTNIFESDGVAFGGGVGFGFVMEEEDEDEEDDKKEIISDSDEELEEEKKVLKVDVPKTEVPEAPVEDEVDVDMGGDIADVDFGDETDEEGGDEFGTEGGEDEDETTKKIQKYTGKIGQMLRDMDEADPDLEKYVINSVISAMHLDDMDEEDKEDIIAKLEGEEDEEGGDDFDMEGGDEEVDVDLDAEETPEGGEELSEDVDLNLDEDDDKDDDEKEVVTITEKQMTMLHKDGICTCDDDICLVYPNAENADADEILEKMEKEETCIVVSEKRMKMLHEKGKCDCGDVTLKYKKGKKEDTNEGRVFSKKQLMESFLRRETKKSLKKVLRERRELCEECLGEGCPSCMNEHHMGSKATYDRYPHYNKEAYILDEDDLMYEKLVGNQSKLDRNKNGRLDSEDFKMLRKGKKRLGEYDEEFLDLDLDFMPEKPRSERSSERPPFLERMKPPFPERMKPYFPDPKPRGLDEEMDVMDAIATGQGYLQATGDLDRDFDGIPNRLDLDNNDDGELDFAMGRDRYSNKKRNDDYIELDIDFIRNSDTGTKEKERTITTPTTNPGEKDKWRKIRRPKVDPRPKAGPKRGVDMDRPRPSYRRRGMFR